MGSCGCGDINPISAFRVGGNIMIIDEYNGCKDCGTPIGLTIHLFSPKEAMQYLDKPVSEVFKTLPPTSWDERSFGFVGRDELVAAAAEFENDYRQYDSLSDFLSDFGLNLLQAAMKKREAPAGNLRNRRVHRTTRKARRKAK